jgi:hypothetical protein
MDFSGKKIFKTLQWNFCMGRQTDMGARGGVLVE